MARLDISKVQTAVHEKLDYSEYDSTIVQNEVNCYCHAIGSTAIHKGIRIGELSCLKPINEKYISEDEVERLFIEDMKSIRLTCRKLKKSNKADIINWLGTHEFKNTESIIMLFVQKNADKSIRDFHFWRYDSEKGFTEKRFWNRLTYIDTPQYSWPEGEMCTFVGAYLLKR